MSSVSSTFPKVKRSQTGYSTEQVEDFLEDARRAYAAEVTKVTGIDSRYIRQVSFDLVKGGYSPEDVDSALDRLEDAFAKRERERAIAERGEEQFYRGVQEEAMKALEQLSAADGEKFPKVGAFTKGYRIAQVDEYAARLASYLNDGPEMTPSEVLTKRFDAQRGGYDEDQVDQTLDVIVGLMRSVR